MEKDRQCSGSGRLMRNGDDDIFLLSGTIKKITTKCASTGRDHRSLL